MRVQFLQPHRRSGDVRDRRVGELAEIPEAEAENLIAQGIAKRHDLDPTETKVETPEEYE